MSTPEEIEDSIEQTRADLAETVDALAGKLDVPARARAKAEDVRDTAAGVADEVLVGVESRPGAAAGVAVAMVTLIGLVIWWRRRR